MPDSERESPRLDRTFVSLTFDVDGEDAVRGESGAQALTAISQAEFATRRGVPRVLACLEDLALPATFFIAGAVAETHARAVEAMLEAGHEVAHHGYRHLPPETIGPTEQLAELESGIEALTQVCGHEPHGYRAPGWRMTPETLAWVAARFTYDSSLMADDRPYFVVADGKELLELPPHWSLDDYVHLGVTAERFAVPSPCRTMFAVWREEIRAASTEPGRHVVLTMHPQVIGRSYAMAALAEFLEEVMTLEGVEFADMRSIARLVRD